MRGRLIFPFLVDFAQLDTAAIEADPDGAGPLTSGYDHVFREPVQLSGGAEADEDGTDARQESTLASVPCQIEPEVIASLQMVANGDAPDSRLILIAHFRHLEAEGLVDADGLATIRKGDRLVRIREYDAPHATVFDPNNVQPLYVHQVQPRGFGLGRKRNLLLIELRERMQGLRG